MVCFRAWASREDRGSPTEAVTGREVVGLEEGATLGCVEGGGLPLPFDALVGSIVRAKGGMERGDVLPKVGHLQELRRDLPLDEILDCAVGERGIEDGDRVVGVILADSP